MACFGAAQCLSFRCNPFRVIDRNKNVFVKVKMNATDLDYPLGTAITCATASLEIND